MLAALKIQFPENGVDAERGIVTGCKLAEVNHNAVFAGKDGEATSLYISPKLIDDLLSHASQQGRLDAYWTHDRLNPENKDKDHIHDSVGVWGNFRKDDGGNLIADIQLEPSPYKDKILWKAANDPKGIMTSLVFRYDMDGKDVKVTSLKSGDFVRQGAGTTALLSAFPDSLSDQPATKTMTIEELVAMLADPAVKSAIKSILDSHEDAESAALEESAGVTDADKDKKDDEKSASMRAVLRITRAKDRQMGEKLAVMKGELLTAAESSFTAKLGKGEAFIPSSAIKPGGVAETPVEAFEKKINANLALKPNDRPMAILRARNDDGEGYSAWRKAGKY